MLLCVAGGRRRHSRGRFVSPFALARKGPRFGQQARCVLRPARARGRARAIRRVNRAGADTRLRARRIRANSGSAAPGNRTVEGMERGGTKRGEGTTCRIAKTGFRQTGSAKFPRPACGATGFTHLCPVARRCITPTACPRESGGRPGPRAGAQPRFSRQPRIGVRDRPRRSGLLSTGCGGIGSQGWVPAFAGTTKRGRKPAQQGQQARRRQAGMRCVHAVASCGERQGKATAPVQPGGTLRRERTCLLRRRGKEANCGSMPEPATGYEPSACKT